MSTTRHLLNRQRRLAAQPRAAEPDTTAATATVPAPRRTPEEAEPETEARTPAPDAAHATARTTTKARAKGAAEADVADAGESETDGSGPGGTDTEAAESGTAESDAADTAADSDHPDPDSDPEHAAPGTTETRRIRLRHRLLALCAVLTLACGAFAAWGAGRADALRDGAAARNSALADPGATSEVKGEVSSAVNDLFSYDHNRPGANRQAAKRLLTGRAVKQHGALLAQVRAQGGKQRLLLTTTVTDSAVAALEGDRARVLLFADQHSTRTGTSGAKAGKSTKGAKSARQGGADDATYAGAMLSVDAVREGGVWKIAGIDTLD